MALGAGVLRSAGWRRSRERAHDLADGPLIPLAGLSPIRPRQDRNITAKIAKIEQATRWGRQVVKVLARR